MKCAFMFKINFFFFSFFSPYFHKIQTNAQITRQKFLANYICSCRKPVQWLVEFQSSLQNLLDGTIFLTFLSALANKHTWIQQPLRLRHLKQKGPPECVLTVSSNGLLTFSKLPLQLSLRGGAVGGAVISFHQSPAPVGRLCIEEGIKHFSCSPKVVDLVQLSLSKMRAFTAALSTLGVLFICNNLPAAVRLEGQGSGVRGRGSTCVTTRSVLAAPVLFPRAYGGVTS